MTTGDVDPQPTQSEAAASSPPDQGAGGLGARFGARVIDGVIVGLISLAVAFLVNLGTGYVGTDWVANWISLSILSVVTFLYFVVLETSLGATPGKKILGLAVEGPGGAPRVTFAQSAIRNSWTLLYIIPFAGSVLYLIAVIAIAVTINNSPTKQGIHDRIAGGTQVVKG